VSPAVRRRIVEQCAGAPFVSSVLRARVLSIRPGEVRLEMAPRKPLRQYQGLLQGGVLTGFADAAATFAVNSLLAPEEDSVTLTLSMSFLAPARGGRITAIARALHRGRRTAVAVAEVHDAEGKLACQGSFTCLVIPSRNAGGRVPRGGAPRRKR
jgi:uncharacterized protein (TIGR00369 family)